MTSVLHSGVGNRFGRFKEPTKLDGPIPDVAEFVGLRPVPTAGTE